MGTITHKRDRFLLDTHVLLWWFFNDPRISKRAVQIISNAGYTILVSSASAWEISTKFRLGKLSGAENIVSALPGLLQKARMEVLPIGLNHALLAGRLANDHRDPFDRMLAAQAIIEKVPLVSSDKVFAEFSVKTIW
ncbi:MAG: PIN domain nuclease [Desulfobacca sp.]|nr:PIN domain nuclease [Desulfobacca sp.]